MIISYDWLKEYVDIDIPAEKLAELFVMAGMGIESIKPAGTDRIFDIEVTSNRPDWLSVIGVAREVAAITGQKLKIPSSLVPSPSSLGNKIAPAGISITVEDNHLCPRYTARAITGAKISKSPENIIKRLAAVGLRPVNNAVDVTNFCLFESGEPMHVFDLDKIKGGRVVVRTARKGEKIVTIDGVERILDNQTLIIADSGRPIAIAGVMGGRDTEVTQATKNILLEAAAFDPVSIRRTARRLCISTDSSYRFERRVDIENIIYASDRATDLVTELTHGTIGGFYDSNKPKIENKMIALRFSRLQKVLGAEIPHTEAKRILQSLGFKITLHAKDAIEVEALQARSDVETEVDLIEEVARIYGYEKIPETLPSLVDQPVRKLPLMVIQEKVRSVLYGLGIDEVMTYSLLSKKALQLFGRGFYGAGMEGTEKIDGGLAVISNPLSIEQEVMRTTLLPGILNVIRHNNNRKMKTLKIFELGNIYKKIDKETFREESTLGIALTGNMVESWSETREGGVYDLKGIVEALLKECGVKKYDFVFGCGSGGRGETLLTAPSESSHPADTKEDGAMHSYTVLFGRVDPRLAGDYDIKEKVYYCELSVDDLLAHADLTKRFTELPKYPSVIRDISLVVPKAVEHRAVCSLIERTGRGLLKDVKLIDVYKGTKIGKDHTSLTYRLEYQNPAKTLEEKEVAEVHTRIVQALEKDLHASLRS